MNDAVKYLVNDYQEIITEDKLNKIHMYYQLLIEENMKINLTSITEEIDVYIKHFYDSLLVSKVISLNNQTLIDIGSGAGFPGIVLKIFFPSLHVTLLEPTTKRCFFLQKVIDTLNLTNINIINERAENYVKSARESYDIGVARAVSTLNILLEISIPLIKSGGNFLAMKGSNYQEELDNSQNAFKALSSVLSSKTLFLLPLSKGERTIIVIKKLAKTSLEYPRQYAKIKKQPL